MAQSLTIVGGGLVGASLACALEPLDLEITVLEETPLDSNAQPSFDERTIALTYGSRRIFEAIGIWDQVSYESGPIHQIHVSNRGHFGFTRLDRQDIGTDALGYVVPTRTLGRALTERLRSSAKIDYRCPSAATAIHNERDTPKARIHTTDGDLETALIVIADGGRSALTQKLGWKKRTKPYSEKALVGIVGVDRPHNGTAFERFTKHGPLALLPLKDERFALAWTLPEGEAEETADLHEDDLLARLQLAFGYRAGRFTRCQQLRVYPLSRSVLTSTVAERCVAIGNSAHTVHPVAGQGFNLGLRDVAQLAEDLACAIREEQDIGDRPLLESYAKKRRAQTGRVLSFTDGLLQAFSNEWPGIRTARNIGLNLIEIFPPAKTLLLKRTVGLAGRLPRLSRGLSLDTM